MKKNIYKIIQLMILLRIFMSNNTLYASFELLPVGARNIGMGCAFVAIGSGPESLFSNCAALSQSTPCISMFLSHPYCMPGLNFQMIGTVFPTRAGSFGIAIKNLGNKFYSENTGLIGYGTRLIKNTYLGVALKLFMLQIQDYGSAKSIGIDAGLLVRLTNKIGYGISIKNINNPRIGKNKEPLPQQMSIGIGYKIRKDLILSIEIDKETGFPVELRSGFEFDLFHILILRGGITTSPSTVCSGIGIKWKIFTMDYAFTNHPFLGSTHQISISIFLGRANS